MRSAVRLVASALLGLMVGAGGLLALWSSPAAADHCDGEDSHGDLGYPADWGDWEVDTFEVDREPVVEAFDDLEVETVADVLDLYGYDESERFDGDCHLNEFEALALYADRDAWSDLENWFNFLHRDGDGSTTAGQLNAWIEAHTNRTIGPRFQPSLHFGTVRDAVGLPREGARGGDGDGTDRDEDNEDDEDNNRSGEGGAGPSSDGDSGGPGAGDTAFGEVADSIGEAAGDLVGRLGDSLSPEESPDFLASDTYQRHYQRMMGWAALIMLPLAMVAIGGAVLRGQSAKIGEIVLGIPAVYLLGTVAVFVVGAAGGLATAMSQMLASDTHASAVELSDNVNEFLLEPSQTVPGLVLLLGLVIALAALVIEIWLILSDAAVYAVVLFIPLAYAGRVWPSSPAAVWGRKLLLLALGFVASKVVIFALWALTVDGLADTTGVTSEGGVGGAIALAALLLLLAVSPMAVLRLVPLVEGAQSVGGATGGASGGSGRPAVPQGLQLAGASVGGVTGSAGPGGAGGRLPVSSGGGSGGRGRPPEPRPQSPGGPTSAGETAGRGAEGPGGPKRPEGSEQPSDEGGVKLGGRPVAPSSVPAAGPGAAGPADPTDEEDDPPWV